MSNLLELGYQGDLDDSNESRIKKYMILQYRNENLVMHVQKIVYISRIHFCSFVWISLQKVNLLAFIGLFFKYIPLSDTMESPKQPNSNYLKLTVKESTVFWFPLYLHTYLGFGIQDQITIILHNHVFIRLPPYYTAVKIDSDMSLEEQYTNLSLHYSEASTASTTTLRPTIIIYPTGK